MVIQIKIINCILTLNSTCCGIRTPLGPPGPPGYLGPMKLCKEKKKIKTNFSLGKNTQ